MIRTFLGAAAVAALLSAPANALTINFTGTVVDGTFAGTVGTGSLTFDEGLLTNVGSEELSPQTDELFALSFTIFGETFTQDDDVDQPEFPLALFFDGVLDDFDYVVSEVNLSGEPQTLIDIAQEGVFGFSLGFGLFDDEIDDDQLPSLQSAVALPNFNVFVDEFGLQPVPLPATLPLLAGAFLLAGAAVRRRRA